MRPATVLDEQEVPWPQALYRDIEFERCQYVRSSRVEKAPLTWIAWSPLRIPVCKLSINFR